MLVFAAAIAGALVVSFFCSTCEAVLLSVRHAEIELLKDARAVRILKRCKREIDAPIAAILTLNTFANTVGAAVAGATYGHVFSESTLWIFSLAFTTAILVFSEILPKTLGVVFAGRLAVPVAYGVAFLMWVLRPFLVFTRGLSRFLQGGRSHPVTSLDEIRLLASLGRTEGVVGARVAEMIEGATALKELSVAEVMVPRMGVAFLSGDRTLEENLAVIRRTGHSRFPYTEDGDLDKVVGVILAKELLFQLYDQGDGIDLKKLAVPPLVVPTGTTLDRLLRLFQDERRHLAVVVDEYGGTHGIVTLEDVLEEIVGEIQDESDRVDTFIVRRPDDSLVCRGWAETRKVFEALGIDAEDVEAVALGGMVANELGRVPRTGDSVDLLGHRFTVLRASPRRAERIEVRRIKTSLPPSSR